MIAAALLLAVLERTPTRCETRNVLVASDVVDKELVGCGDTFTENILWNLDRADNVLDGHATRATLTPAEIEQRIKDNASAGVACSSTSIRRGSGRRGTDRLLSSGAVNEEFRSSNFE